MPVYTYIEYDAEGVEILRYEEEPFVEGTPISSLTFNTEVPTDG